MDSPKITYKYYSNPAFCAQSEVVYTQQSPCVSPKIICSPTKSANRESKRIPPLGANSPRKILPHQEYRGNGNHRVKTDISDNPLRNLNGSQHFELPPKPGPKPIRQGSINSGKKEVKHLNKVIATRRNVQKFQENLEMYQVGKTESVDDVNGNPEMETSVGGRILKHRYAEIPDEYDDYSPSKKRIIETEPEEYSVDDPSDEEENEVPSEIVRSVNGKVHRYAIIPSDEEDGIIINFEKIEASSPPTFHIRSPEMSRKHIEATRRLHEFLATPKKEMVVSSPLKSCLSSPSLRSQINAQNGRVLSPTDFRNNITSTPSKNITSSTPKQMTPSKSYVNIASPPLPRRNSNLNSSISPRAQQKLNYGLPNNNFSLKKDIQEHYIRDKSLDNSYDLADYKKHDKEHLFIARSTAVISPRLVTKRNDTIYSDRHSENGWKPTPACATLILAAAMLALCGGLTAALSFYIMYTIGREYYLDVGVMSGFTCLILGLLGCRSKTSQLLPNRNYISGYIVISVFSLMSCGALLYLLYLGQDWGHGTLKKYIGIIVSSLGALSLLFAIIGTVSSYCCGHPPPDNRVANAVEV